MGSKYILNEKYAYFQEHLLNIQNIFTTADNTIHKARNELKIVEIDGIQYVIKSFKVPHLFNRIAYTYFRDGKAKKSYLNAVKLRELGVNTPEPVGVIEFFQNGLLTQSYFVSLYEPYDFTIREVFHHKVENVNEVLEAFAHFTYQLHQKGVWHVDYSLGNILITKEQKNNYRFSLVDINRMEFRSISPQEGLLNLNKFWAQEEDLKFLVKEYAKLGGLEFDKAYAIVKASVQKVEKTKEIKNYLKNKK